MPVSPSQYGTSNRSGIYRRLLKTKEAAYYLGISTWKVRKLVIEGKLPCVADSDSGPWLFDIHDLDTYIDANKRTM
jgi:excisionase family DNA binding protein